MNRRLGVGLTAVAVVVAGCGHDQDPVERVLAARDGWARPTPAAASRGVVYLTLTTDTTDAIVGAAVPDDVAGAATLHETTQDGGHGGHHGGGGAGELSMAEVTEMTLRPGVETVFAPGGHHVMLEDLPDPLERGESFTLTLMLRSGRSLEVDVDVRDGPPGDSSG